MDSNYCYCFKYHCISTANIAPAMVPAIVQIAVIALEVFIAFACISISSISSLCLSSLFLRSSSLLANKAFVVLLLSISDANCSNDEFSISLMSVFRSKKR